jgi:TolA-binding protein
LPEDDTPASQPRRGCWQQVGRLFSTLLFALFIILTTLAAAGALAFFGFGYQPDIPRRVAGTSQELENLRQYNDELQGQVGTLQTTVAELELQASNTGEDVDELNRQIGEMAALAEQLQDNVSIAATTQAETRDSQLAIFTFATVQAERDAEISELLRRTDRLVRFLQRLDDITSDATLDLDVTPTPGDPNQPTPVPTITPTPTPTMEPYVAPTELPPQEEATPTPTPTATTEEAAPTPTEQEEEEATTTVTPTATLDTDSDL